MVAPATFRVVASTVPPPDAEDIESTLRWLNGDLTRDYPHWAAVLKALVARPVMPKNPHLDVISQTFTSTGYTQTEWDILQEGIQRYHRALYEHLTAPPALVTKQVEVWHVESAIKTPKHGWVPTCAAYETEAEARHKAQGLAEDWKPVRVTGPHRQLVPAD